RLGGVHRFQDGFPDGGEGVGGGRFLGSHCQNLLFPDMAKRAEAGGPIIGTAIHVAMQQC
ncbi:MAG: hypothetical protein RIG67_27755, partial [Rhodospirillales bacterium]